MRAEPFSFATNRGGSVSVFAAVSFVGLIGVAALAIDLSSFYFQKRHLQSAADLASIAAAADPARAQAAVIASLASNGFDSDALEAVETGVYANSPAVPAASRFTPGVAGAQAVRVTLKIDAPLMFAKIFSLAIPAARAAQTTNFHVVGGTVAIRAKAVAATTATAAFAVGSRLLQLDGGILNAVLGGLLGANLSLSLMDYQALASARVDLFAFSNALATRTNLTAATYSAVAQGSFRSPDIVRSAADALQPSSANAAAATALTGIASSLSTGTNVSLSSVLSFGPYGNRAVGATAPVTMTVSALDLLSAIGQVASGQHQVQMALAVSLPGIASANLSLAVGERPVATSFAAAGLPGASVHTAQTRLLLTVVLAGTPPASLVSVPIYIELASATAQLSAVQCDSATPSSVTLSVLPSVADAAIGAVSSTDLTNFSTAPNPAPATLLNLLGLATVTGRSHVALSNLAATPVTFSTGDIAAAAKKTVSTTDVSASLLSSLIGGLQLNVNVIGLGLGVPSGLTASVAQVIAGAATPIDQLLNGVLTALGVGIGQADTWVSGVRCGQAVLVN